jgi:transmembrane sensor
MTTRSPKRDVDRIEMEAAIWVSRRLAGRPDETDEAAFARWLADDPHHAAAYEGLAAVWGDPGLWAAVAAEAERPAPGRAALPRRVILGAGLGLAAALAVIVGVAAPWRPTSYTQSWHTEAGELRTVALPDGSLLRLNGRTAASAAFSRDQRQLLLSEGELLVDVARADAPFVVRVGDIEARALGTRYNVDRHAGFVDIAVLHGVVEVRRGAANRRVAAGQSVRVSAGIEVLAQEAQTLAVWTDGWVEAQGLPLDALVEELSRFSAIPIRIEDASLSAREVSGRFVLTAPNETLATLAAVYGLTIDYQADQIVLRVAR